MRQLVPCTPILALGLALLQDAAPDTRPERVVVEAREGRFLVEREVRLGGERTVHHGRWRRWAVDDAGQPVGEPVAEGSWSDGLLDGEWIWRDADGTTRMRGAYAAGRRNGPWQLFHADGEPAGTGEYAHGLRYGSWTALAPDGSRDEDRAGTYDQVRANWPQRTARYRVETRRQVRHGDFHAFARDGRTPLVIGRYAEGLPDGWWSSWLVDGTLDTEIVTGWYEAGERVGDAPRALPDDIWERPLEERLQLEGELARGAGGLPVARRYGRGISAKQRAEVRERLAAYAGGAEEHLSDLRATGRPLVSDVLQGLVETDLASAGEVLQAQRLNALLREICGGRGFAWRTGTGEGDRAANRLTQARWLTWWELVLDDDEWWQELEDGLLDPDEALLTFGLLTGHEEPGSVAARRPADAAGAPPSPAGRVPRSEEKIHAALRAALIWLLEHQSEPGAWRSAAFPERCGRASASPCDGAGHPHHDVGVSALAILALTGGGRAAGVAGLEEAVGRGLDWLVSRQRRLEGAPDDGLIGSDLGMQFLYDHAVATAALCEGYRSTNRADLLPAIERAVALILRARNPAAGWRYALPPDGDSDTSVTAWMVYALKTAQEIGLRTDAEALAAAFAGAAKLVDELTDPDTGRTGYSSAGSYSSRIVGVNDHYPVDRTECLTAAALRSRFLLGQDPERDPVLVRQADLILRALPEWRADGMTNDMYYWYHGTQALYLVGLRSAPHWERWSQALKAALLAGQRTGGHAKGSWDPIGPWGQTGGRVYSTALGALALETVLHAALDPARRR